jgi:hypothetical protein
MVLKSSLGGWGVGDLERGFRADERLHLDIDVIAIPAMKERLWFSVRLERVESTRRAINVLSHRPVARGRG